MSKKKETYRVEVRVRFGWRLVHPEAVGVTARKANKFAEAEREHQTYYARLGANPQRVRVVRESDGRGLWLA